MEMPSLHDTPVMRMCTVNAGRKIVVRYILGDFFVEVAGLLVSSFQIKHGTLIRNTFDQFGHSAKVFPSGKYNFREKGG